METTNTTTKIALTSKEIYTMKFAELRKTAKEMNVYVGQHPTTEVLRQKLISAITAESREGPGRPPKVPTQDLIDAVNASNNLMEVLNHLSLPEFNQFGQPNVRWLSCRLSNLRSQGYKIKEFPRGRRKAVVEEAAPSIAPAEVAVAAA